MAFQTPLEWHGMDISWINKHCNLYTAQLQVSFFQIHVKPCSDSNKKIIYANCYNVEIKRKNTYSLRGSSSIGPLLSKYWLKAVSITAGLVQTAEKFSFSVMHAIPDGILSQTLEFSRQQTLSRPVGIDTQFPQMHLHIK